VQSVGISRSFPLLSLFAHAWHLYTSMTQIFLLLQGLPDYPPPDFVLDALSGTTKNPMLHQYTRGQVWCLLIFLHLALILLIIRVILVL
jgi:hypothetical protein